MAVSRTLTSSGTAAGNGALHTFAAQALGTAAADRLMFVVFHLTDGSGGAVVASMTIAGISATSAGSQVDGSADECSIWWAPVPTGTSGDIVATYDTSAGAFTGVSFAAYSVIGANTTSPVSDFNSATSSGTGVTVPASGALIAGTFTKATTSTITWTDATEDIDISTSTTSGRFSTASGTTAGVLSSLSAMSAGSPAAQIIVAVAIAQAVADVLRAQQML